MRALAQRRWRGRSADERGVFATFIAVIATALLFFGGIAYDAPRLTAARQDALHAANEAARVAAATIASGGTIQDAEDAATCLFRPRGQDPMDLCFVTGQGRRLVYGAEITVLPIDCVGSRVEVIVRSRYTFRSVIGIARAHQPIVQVGAAEAFLVLPSDEPSTLHYLGECPLSA